MLIKAENILYTEVPSPPMPKPHLPVDLTDATMQEHKAKILQRMQNENYDSLVIYGDREHGGNFGYLAGFEPRFEEAVIVLHRSGKAFMLLGNEALRMAAYSRMAVTAIHTPFFSLPNQPMDGEAPLEKVFEKAEIIEKSKVGIVGWKMFTCATQDPLLMFDVPEFITKAVKTIVGGGTLQNAADIFIHPEKGARCTMNANEIAHYEFGAALASYCVFKTIDAVELGKAEMELAENLAAYGQPVTVQTICATGERFKNAIVAPRAQKVTLGDRFSTTMGLRGGLSNRVAYIAETPQDLPSDVSDYVSRVAKPYYAAATTWYSSIKTGILAGKIYEIIDDAAPKAEYYWGLNPGHLTSSEEWLSSPISAGSTIALASGMMLQMDIIFGVPGYGGCNAEDGIALADESLRLELSQKYPEVWQRITARRNYMKNVLCIPISDDVLPLSNIAGYLRPLLLNRGKAFKVNV